MGWSNKMELNIIMHLMLILIINLCILHILFKCIRKMLLNKISELMIYISYITNTITVTIILYILLISKILRLLQYTFLHSSLIR
jgi:hypothetical protein